MKPIFSKLVISNARSFCWRVAVLLVGLKFAAAALATVPLYENYSVLDYQVPGNPPPTIDASNFVNINSFNIGYSQSGQNFMFYEPENTVNYTNTGLMTVNSPLTSFGNFGFTSFNGVGVGFQFDTLTTNIIPHRSWPARFITPAIFAVTRV